MRFIRKSFEIMAWFAFFVALMSVPAYLLIRYTVIARTVTVPNIIGKGFREAHEILDKQNLFIKLKPDGGRQHSSLPEGRIMEQYPTFGTVVKTRREVSVVISIGSEMVRVPTIRGNFNRAGRIRLEDAGLTMGRIARIHSGRPEDVVLAQFPSEGEMAERGSPVDLLVSAGEGGKEYWMPDLRNISGLDATRFLSRMGLQPDLKVIAMPDLPQGIVLAASPSVLTPVNAETPTVLTTTVRQIPSEGQGHYSLVTWKLEPGLTDLATNRVTIEGSDDDGVWLVEEGVFPPGHVFHLLLLHHGDLLISIYVDGELRYRKLYQ